MDKHRVEYRGRSSRSNVRRPKSAGARPVASANHQTNLQQARQRPMSAGSQRKPAPGRPAKWVDKGDLKRAADDFARRSHRRPHSSHSSHRSHPRPHSSHGFRSERDTPSQYRTDLSQFDMQRSSGRLSTFSIQRAAEESRATEIPQAVKIMYHSQGWDDPSAPYRLEKPNTPEVEVGARAPTGSAKLCADNRRNYLNTVTSCRTLLDLQIDGSKVEMAAPQTSRAEVERRFYNATIKRDRNKPNLTTMWGILKFADI